MQQPFYIRRPRLEDSMANAPYPGDAFFVNSIGELLVTDYREAGQQLDAGAATWFARVIWDVLHGDLTLEQSIAKHRIEWRAALGL